MPSLAQRASALLNVHPSHQFRRDRWFQLRYDLGYATAAVAVIALVASGLVTPFFGAPTGWWIAAFPFVLYAAIAAHLLVHNAGHGSFPRPWNRLAGELCGVLIAVRFVGWTLIHVRHHKYSDDRVDDPHPNFPSFFRTALYSILQVERQLMKAYYVQWGDTPENHARERLRARVSYATTLLLFAAWAAVLGPWFFVTVFLPAQAGAALFVIHFNWVTHNGAVGRDFAPVDQDTGWFWLGNRLFAGIYMHATHHERPYLFNPLFRDKAPRAGVPGGASAAPNP
jgi:stearoyl-CoA desaturase (delta-9 desaturase)